MTRDRPLSTWQRKKAAWTWREKAFGWYLERRFYFLQRLWIWGWIGPDRPTFASEGWDTRLISTIFTCIAKIKRFITGKESKKKK